MHADKKIEAKLQLFGCTFVMGSETAGGGGLRKRAKVFSKIEGPCKTVDAERKTVTFADRRRRTLFLQGTCVNEESASSRLR